MTRDLKIMLFINLYSYSPLISIAYNLGTFIQKSPPPPPRKQRKISPNKRPLSIWIQFDA
jgi:hypothetical protein